ncbi:MAG TPA: membrane protein insertion efficiency factor YidD [Ruminiclostridium sp.]|jgi:putative membrane protein insertion efficiency factor|nr:membrane protein insertion efficiency factor YidD [Clostridiaceae bacterium]HAA24865.1 membrane protein insertion efficiency factor YidD [Ruminiclostridium sp.]
MKPIILFFIELYRKYISPLKVIKACRFYPTCSAYAYDAINTYGVSKGILLAMKRIAKCHPFHPGGYDPLRREGE